MIIYDHNVPTAIICTGVISALVVMAFSYWRFVEKNIHTLAIALVRLLFMAVLTWCMFMPELRKEDIAQLKSRFIVAMDVSSSMKLSPSEDVSNRWSVVQEAMGMDWTRYVQSQCEMDIYPFATDVGAKVTLSEMSGLAPDGMATFLRDSLKKVTGRYAGQNVGGCIVFSDGLDTREAYDDWAAESWPFPVYTVRLEPDGIWEVEPDVHVDAVNTPRRVTVGWETELKVALSGQGTKGQPQAVQLYKNGQLAQELPFQIPAGGGAKEVVFKLENPEIGVYSYRVVVPPLEGETNKEDNQYEVTVIVIDAKNRLLYVEGPPRWESKFLSRVLKANQQAIALGFIRGMNGQFMSFGNRGSMTPDMREDQLAFFKIVVLGNLDAEELGEVRAKALSKFVEDGGSLVLLGGLKAWGAKGFLGTSLQKIMPIKGLKTEIEEGTFPVSLTDAGKVHPAFAGKEEFWDVVPPVLSIFPEAVLAPAAETLVVASTPQGPQSLIVSQRYGQGKVAVVLTDSLWKWQLTEESTDNKPYQRFWEQLIGWLTPDKEKMDMKSLELFADREQLYLGEEIEISAKKSEQAEEDKSAGVEISCEITDAEKRKIPFAMAQQHVMTSSGKSFPGYAFKFKAEKAGMHSAVGVMVVNGKRVESDPISFFVKPFTPESMPKPLSVNVLKMLASSSGGKYFESIQDLNNEVQSLSFATKEEAKVEYKSLWRIWWMIGIMMGILTAGWIMRKLRNMP